MEFTVKITNGEVFINGEYVSQLCFDSEAIAFAIANWLDSDTEDDM